MIIFPVMFMLIRERPVIALLLIFAIHTFIDVIFNIFQLSDSLYRMLIFRYFVFIAMGIVVYLYSQQLNHSICRILIITLATLSLVYIYQCSYGGYQPMIFAKWTSTSLPTVFWAMALVMLGMRFLAINKSNIITMIIRNIGKASWHIFLVQMIWFMIILQIGLSVNVIVNIIGCVAVGLTFWKLEMWVKLQKFI